jgi:tRNA (mo5U34)-methyltransferase
MTSNPSPEEARRAIEAVTDWYHRIEVAPGVVTPGINDSPHTLEHLGLPDDCSGLRALDIGARDGFFSFELERRGAEVLAMDFMPPDMTGFSVASRLLGSEVRYVTDNVYNLDPATHGEFDVVLFLGLLYHLRNPLQALDVIWQVCRGELFVETQLLDNCFRAADGSMRRLDEVDPELTKVPMMQFYPRDSLNRDFTNWWAPNAVGLESMLDAAGFDVDRVEVLGTRGIAHARRVEDPERQWFRTVDATSDLSSAGSGGS